MFFCLPKRQTISVLLAAKRFLMKSYYLNDKQEIKRKLVEGTIMPFIEQVVKVKPDGLTACLMQHSRIITGVKDQFLEEPGPYEEGQFFLFESGIARAFYCHSGTDTEITTHLFTKHDLTFDAAGFSNHTERIKYVQMLEDGIVFSISFLKLQVILDNYPGLLALLFPFTAMQQQQYDQYQHLLKLPVDERVQLFLESKPGIASRVSKELLAQYLGVGRTGFSTAYAKYGHQQARS